ncbi:MAG: threonine--tRNA ligase [Bacilli bacterium]|nr:threonine--tRNA ligase [Bacilli bacterium]MDD4053780.1 threonine--tRNA ligase [Bacilli bacterium]MDD4411646.1 threonine--tRNA ligase [Bacilli bacterium]
MINIKENEQLNKLNHSCAHLLAHAVKNLYPHAMFWVGPVIDEGFYYDIDLGTDVIKEEDLVLIEKEMRKISKDNKRITRLELSKREALDMFENDLYKIDLINNLADKEIITAYKQDSFIDLCRGPHMESTKDMKYFKLLKVSGAYFKGDSKNKVLQRIYGVCFNTEEDLNEHILILEDRKNRDHRKLGKELDIFMTHDLVGPGLPMWLPNGATVRRILERYIADKELSLGYSHVYTPSLANVELYKTSGHWDHYKENMFPPMKMDEEEFVLRPMNCPHHMLIYKNSIHSYRDLPIRIGELAHDFRYEASGAVCGLERVRAMCQNDAHLFVRPDQIEEEFANVVKLILDVYNDFNINNYSFRLSLRDKEDKDKYFDDDAMWEKAESTLRKVLNDLDVEFFEAEGEAAFYGPKLDVQVQTALGHEITLSTCQLDFLLPERFNLTYIDNSGEKKRPVVLHRAILGTIDRFTAFLIEETKGAFPLWLAPIQINILPVNNQFHLDYAKKINELLLSENIRVILDEREEKVSYKMRESQIKKIPYTLILGDREVADNSVSYRKYNSEETITVSKDEFVVLINDQIKKMK